MAGISVTNKFLTLRDNDADDLNTNFTDVVNGLSDGTKTLTVSALITTAVACTGLETIGSDTVFRSVNTRTGLFQITTTDLNRITSILSQNSTNGPIFNVGLNTAAVGAFGFPNTGNILANFTASGGDTTNSRFSSGGNIIFTAVSTWTSTNHECSYILQLVGSGSTSLTTVHAINSAGDHTFLGKFGCNGQTPATRQTYSASNVTTDRTYDANATTLDEVADILGTLIADLRATGLVA